MPYKTRLDPPPANGWVPPPLPPLEELTANSEADVAASKKSRARRTSDSPSQTDSSTTDSSTSNRKMNLFDEAPPTLFDDIEDEGIAVEPPPPPKPLGPIRINGHNAQLIEKRQLDSARTQYRVILDDTGEVKSFVSPPAVLEP